MADIRFGTRLGVDVGKARVGVSRSDPHGMLATPLETVPRDGAKGDAHARRIAELVAEYDAIEIVVGMPLSLSGAETASTADARSVAEQIAAHSPVPLRLVDERLTTVSASRQLRDVGRKASRSRHIIDQMAAVVILQTSLDAERQSGRAPGELLSRKDQDSDGQPAPR